MRISSLRAFRCAAALGFLAVALGALGAHGLDNVFAAQPKAREWWEKAVFHQAVQAVVMLLTACLQPFPAVACTLLGTGVCLFSGSLYIAAVGGPHWLVHVTPFGGLFLLAGWFWLVVRPPVPRADGKGGPA